MKYIFFLFTLLAILFSGCGEVDGELSTDGTGSPSGINKSVVITGLSAYNGESGFVLAASFEGETLKETYAGGAGITNGRITTNILEYNNGTFGDPWTGSGEYLLMLGIGTSGTPPKRFLYTNGMDINCHAWIVMYTYNFIDPVSTVDFSKFKEFDSSICEGMDL